MPRNFHLIRQCPAINFCSPLSFLLHPIVSFPNALQIRTAIFGTALNSVLAFQLQKFQAAKRKINTPHKMSKQAGTKGVLRAPLSARNPLCLSSHHLVKIIKKGNKMANTNIQINKDPYYSQLLTISGNPCAVFLPSVVFTIPIFVSASQSSSK